jgi:hypothetical protein
LLIADGACTGPSGSGDNCTSRSQLLILLLVGDIAGSIDGMALVTSIVERSH